MRFCVPRGLHAKHEQRTCVPAHGLSARNGRNSQRPVRAVRGGHGKRCNGRNGMRPVSERLVLCGGQHNLWSLPCRYLRLPLRRSVHALLERYVQRHDRRDLLFHVSAARLSRGLLRPRGRDVVHRLRSLRSWHVHHQHGQRAELWVPDLPAWVLRFGTSFAFQRGLHLQALRAGHCRARLRLHRVRGMQRWLVRQ